MTRQDRWCIYGRAAPVSLLAFVMFSGSMRRPLDRWITLIPNCVWTCVWDQGHRLSEQLSLHSDCRDWNKGEIRINQVTEYRRPGHSSSTCLHFVLRVCLKWEQKAPHNSNSTAACRFLCQPRGLFTLEHAQFASPPCNNSRRESSHTLTHSTPACSGSETERRGFLLSCWAHCTRTQQQNTHTLLAKGEYTTLQILFWIFVLVRSL